MTMHVDRLVSRAEAEASAAILRHRLAMVEQRLTALPDEIAATTGEPARERHAELHDLIAERRNTIRRLLEVTRLPEPDAKRAATIAARVDQLAASYDRSSANFEHQGDYRNARRYRYEGLAAMALALAEFPAPKPMISDADVGMAIDDGIAGGIDEMGTMPEAVTADR